MYTYIHMCVPSLSLSLSVHIYIYIYIHNRVPEPLLICASCVRPLQMAMCISYVLVR